MLAAQKRLVTAEAPSRVDALNIPSWLPEAILIQLEDHFPFAPMVSLHRLDLSMEWKDREFMQDVHNCVH